MYTVLFQIFHTDKINLDIFYLARLTGIKVKSMVSGLYTFFADNCLDTDKIKRNGRTFGNQFDVTKLFFD